MAKENPRREALIKNIEEKVMSIPFVILKQGMLNCFDTEDNLQSAIRWGNGSITRHIILTHIQDDEFYFTKPMKYRPSLRLVWYHIGLEDENIFLEHNWYKGIRTRDLEELDSHCFKFTEARDRRFSFLKETICPTYHKGMMVKCTNFNGKYGYITSDDIQIIEFDGSVFYAEVKVYDINNNVFTLMKYPLHLVIPCSIDEFNTKVDKLIEKVKREISSEEKSLRIRLKELLKYKEKNIEKMASSKIKFLDEVASYSVTAQ